MTREEKIRLMTRQLLDDPQVRQCYDYDVLYYTQVQYLRQFLLEMDYVLRQQGLPQAVRDQAVEGLVEHMRKLTAESMERTRGAIALLLSEVEGSENLDTRLDTD